MIYVYAVTEPATPPPGLLGHEDAPVRAIPAGTLSAVVSDVSAAPETTEDALLLHEAVVEEAMLAGPVMPMRFGSVVADEDAVRVTLRSRESELSEGLERVRGAVELGVRVLWESDEAESDAVAPAIAPASGTDYLMRRLGETRRTRELVDRIHEPLAERARASTRRLLATPRLLLSGAYLVDEGEVAAFGSLVDDLDAQLHDVAIISTGPWPPYSFVPTQPPQ